MSLSIALAQINSAVGELQANVATIIDVIKRADAKLVVFPELTVCGYSPEDLLLREDFLDQCESGLQEICAAVTDQNVIIGHPQRANGKLFNALSVLYDGKVQATYCKRQLPNFGVFDERRYFQPGDKPLVVEIGGVKIGLIICEDIWHSRPFSDTAAAGAELIICSNASPFHQEKNIFRETMVSKRAREFKIPTIYLNNVGGQDELVFDGQSFVACARGVVVARLPAFATNLTHLNYNRGKFKTTALSPMPPRLELNYRAIVFGIKEYVDKNNFPGVVVGLSGGIDSALTLTCAVDALGAERVMAVAMPSKYTADISLQDARMLAENLKMRYEEISIEPMVASVGTQLAPILKDAKLNIQADITQENIQARCRGLLLMAVSNKFKFMVLNTANKSESAVGFTTLYGDMVGGFAPLKDVYKTQVYALAEYRNQQRQVIPPRVLTRAPSAELSADQTDQDRLPAYDVLDAILEMYIEQDSSAQQIISAGFDKSTVLAVIKMVIDSEHKRRQAAPGIRITTRAFGKDWRQPITRGSRV